MVEIKEIISKFMDQKEFAEDRSKATIDNYHWVFKHLLQLMPEIKVLNDINHDNVVEFLKRVSTREKTVGHEKVVGISTSTKRTYISKLNTFCVWLNRNGYKRDNPMDKESMPRPKIIYKNRKYLDLDQVRRILVAISHNIRWSSNFIKARNELIIVLAITCGLRRSELLGITLSDIDLDNRKITIRGVTSKSKKTRFLHINAWCMDILKKYLLERRNKHYKNPHLFVSDMVDRPFTTHGLKHMLKKVENTSGIDFHMHNFRHTFAYILKKNNTNTSSIQNLLGHSAVQHTQKYLENFPDDENDKYIDQVTLQNLK